MENCGVSLYSGLTFCQQSPSWIVARLTANHIDATFPPNSARHQFDKRREKEPPQWWLRQMIYLMIYFFGGGLLQQKQKNEKGMSRSEDRDHPPCFSRQEAPLQWSSRPPPSGPTTRGTWWVWRRVGGRWAEPSSPPDGVVNTGVVKRASERVSGGRALVVGVAF